MRLRPILMTSLAFVARRAAARDLATARARARRTRSAPAWSAAWSRRRCSAVLFVPVFFVVILRDLQGAADEARGRRAVTDGGAGGQSAGLRRHVQSGSFALCSAPQNIRLQASPFVRLMRLAARTVLPVTASTGSMTPSHSERQQQLLVIFNHEHVVRASRPTPPRGNCTALVRRRFRGSSPMFKCGAAYLQFARIGLCHEFRAIRSDSLLTRSKRAALDFPHASPDDTHVA